MLLLNAARGATEPKEIAAAGEKAAGFGEHEAWQNTATGTTSGLSPSPAPPASVPCRARGESGKRAPRLHALLALATSPAYSTSRNALNYQAQTG